MLAEMSDSVVLEQLVHRAGGLFIWAATACRFVEEGGALARRRLSVLLRPGESAAGTHPERKLDEIYTSVLRNALRENHTDEEKEEVCCLLKTLLGTIVVLFSSLSVTSLASLVCLQKNEVFDNLRVLHSIFHIPENTDEPILPQHDSVRGFLLNKRRCTDSRFRVDEREIHTQLARQCLRLMNDKLKKNICGFQGHGILVDDIDKGLVDDYIPPQLRYACLYWVEHVHLSGNAQSLRSPVNSFLREHLLHLLEVLGLIDKLSYGVEMLNSMGSLYVGFPFIKSSPLGTIH
jgi:hypothetical protein